MSSVVQTALGAVASIEDVCSRIETSFASAGDQLGRGHALFRELNQGLETLSSELSGAELEDASQALQDIAARLNGLAQALPAESVLLTTIGKGAAEAGALLKQLDKHVQMILIVARSAKIEAASLQGDRDNFLAFTGEADNLAKEVRQSVERCGRDQSQLLKAVDACLKQQKDFEQRYRGQLVSAGTDLAAAYAGIQQQRNGGVQLADVASGNTKRVADAVGRLIISMQAGDSTRQRLEHVCHGLQRGIKSASDNESDSSLVIQLQAEQLKDSHSEFDRDIGDIVQNLSGILGDASAVTGRNWSLDGGDRGNTVLERVKQTLAQSLKLIATCESAGGQVDAALAIVADTLERFRQAVTGFSEAVVDLTLIGMNAGLKAAHLGRSGTAFVAIANELKVAADSVSSGGLKLKPILDAVEQAADELRELRAKDDPKQLSRLEPAILKALQEVEGGNARLGRLIGALTKDGAEFETLVKASRQTMTTLGEAAKALPSMALRIERETPAHTLVPASAGDMLDELYARYTMEREREVHRQFLRRFGFAFDAPAVVAEADDGIELF